MSFRSGQPLRKAFSGQFGELPFGYDHKYVYSHMGYNLGISDMQAAVGCAQLKKLPAFTEKRKYNWKFLLSALKRELSELGIKYSDGVYDENAVTLPVASENADPSWFGFSLTLKKGSDRTAVIKKIEQSGVQTRLLFAGNFVRQPAFDLTRNDPGSYRIVGELKNTDIITERTFWVGVYPGLDDSRLSYQAKAIANAIKECE